MSDDTELTFTWTIKNFDIFQLHEGSLRGIYLTSPSFKAEGVDEIEWQLRLYPYGEHSPGKTTVCLRVKDKGEHDFRKMPKFSAEVGIRDLVYIGLDFSNRDHCIKQGRLNAKLSDYYQFCRFTLSSRDELIIICQIKCKEKQVVIGWEVDTFLCDLDFKVNRLPKEFSSSACSVSGNAFKFLFDERDTSVAVEVSSINNKLREELKCELSYLYPYYLNNSLETGYFTSRGTNKFVCNFSKKFPFPGSHINTCILRCDLLPMKVTKTNISNEMREMAANVSHEVKQMETNVFDATREIIGNETKRNARNETLLPMKQTETSASGDHNIMTALLADLQSMAVDPTYTDVKFEVSGKKIPAHSCVLAARSPVFSAMFQQDMKEAKSGIVDILDCESETFEQFLQFVYAGTFQSDQADCEKVLQLYMLADKYQVLSLKDACSARLGSLLSLTNICEVLTASDMVLDSTLKKAAIAFIEKNATQVTKSKNWFNWVETHIKLATEVYAKLSERFQ